MAATAAMSVIDICGLPGDSIQSNFVLGVIALSKAARSVLLASVSPTPARLRTLWSNRYVPP